MLHYGQFIRESFVYTKMFKDEEQKKKEETAAIKSLLTGKDCLFEIQNNLADHFYIRPKSSKN